MSASIEDYIDDLRHTVTAAQLNYDIWWVYKSEDTRPAFNEALKRHTTFFQTSLHAHFVALLLALYRLYETRSDTFNIPRLLKRLRDEAAVDPAVLDELDGMLASAKPLWVKVSVLRNNAFGHRSTSHTIEDAFREAGVTPNELMELMEQTKRLLNKLTLAFDSSTHAFNASARKATLDLLADVGKPKQG